MVRFEHNRVKVLVGENDWSLQKDVTLPGLLPQEGILLFLVYAAFHTAES